MWEYVWAIGFVCGNDACLQVVLLHTIPITHPTQAVENGGVSDDIRAGTLANRAAAIARALFPMQPRGPARPGEEQPPRFLDLLQDFWKHWSGREWGGGCGGRAVDVIACEVACVYH